MALKLLYITNGIDGAAGLERVLSIKASMLADKYNYKIHIITLNQKNSKPFYNFSNHISFHNIKTPQGLIKYVYHYVTQMKWLVKTIKPDVILVCDDGLKGFFLPVILRKPCPMVYERHVSKNIEKTQDQVSFLNRVKFKIISKLMHLGAKSYNKFVVLTNDNLAEWNLNNLQVISNPLSFYPNEKASLNNKVVLAVGRHSYQKGYDRLLAIWGKVIENHPDWQLKIFGKIDKSLKLEELSQSLGLEANVSFNPPTKEILQEYLKASIFVLTSRFEGFGMVLTEAMACGVPVISFDCPCGPKDIISNEIDGILIPNDNIDAFAKAIMYLIENTETRNNMGQNGKENVKRFLPEYIVEQWDNLFKEIS